MDPGIEEQRMIAHPGKKDLDVEIYMLGLSTQYTVGKDFDRETGKEER
jgi:hypothetical protein